MGALVCFCVACVFFCVVRLMVCVYVRAILCMCVRIHLLVHICFASLVFHLLIKLYISDSFHKPGSRAPNLAPLKLNYENKNTTDSIDFHRAPTLSYRQLNKQETRNVETMLW